MTAFLAGQLPDVVLPVLAIAAYVAGRGLRPALRPPRPSSRVAPTTPRHWRTR